MKTGPKQASEERTDSLSDEPVRAGTSEAPGRSEAELQQIGLQVQQGKAHACKPVSQRRTAPPLGLWAPAARFVSRVRCGCFPASPGTYRLFPRLLLEEQEGVFTSCFAGIRVSAAFHKGSGIALE